MIKIAIVGTGIIGVEHIKAISQVEDAKLCALCDVNEEVAKKLSEEYNVPYFTDYKDIPGNVEVDAVILNLPHFLHCESTVFFLESGINVLIEKPMANTVAECDKMIEAAKKNNKKLAVGHVQRFFDHNRKIKELAKSGKLGKFCMYTETRNIDYFASWRPKWFLDKEKAGGGVSMNYGAHAMDKLFYLLGHKPVKTAGNLANFKNDATIEGHAQFMVFFPEGVSAAITLDGYGNVPATTEYFFTDGSIRMFEGEGLKYQTNEEWIKIEKSPDAKNHMVFQIEEFCKFLKGEPSETPDGEYGRAVIAALEQLY